MQTAAPATAIDRDAIVATERLIRPHIRRTPVMAIDPRDFGLECGALTLKLELLQHAGSFKARGAFASLLSRKVPPAGVAAASGGNHGAAVAFAARKLGIPAKIFVPTVASPAKKAQIGSTGAELVITGERYADALAACEDWIARSGALSVHAYDQAETLLGQGTLGMELEAQAPDIETLLVAVGGGGLIGGIASWYAGRVKIVGVEPTAAPTLTKALAAGQ
ncbi:MAG: pyridoxal-phosphate dependent enzyme, partial [Alphaproteobacteria bacterium]|nr:pyridoxal-phosphate dependent enzyme [Alphaproteobacteria bacterium]